MPHAAINTGVQTASGDFGSQILIPGITPGGQFAGRVAKPAMLIKEALVEIIDIDTGATANINGLDIFLKLSQENSLDPGLILLIEQITLGATATADLVQALNRQRYDYWRGSIWAPAHVGVRVAETGSLGNWNFTIHLDYEMVMIPWMDWFIRWDFLDNVVNNRRDY